MGRQPAYRQAARIDRRNRMDAGERGVGKKTTFRRENRVDLCSRVRTCISPARQEDCQWRGNYSLRVAPQKIEGQGKRITIFNIYLILMFKMAVLFCAIFFVCKGVVQNCNNMNEACGINS